MAEAAVLAWVRGPETGYAALRRASATCSVRDFIHRHCQDQGIPAECFFVRCNGVLVGTSDTLQHGAVYSLEPRLLGGKGGFGSMLRALGAQIEKTTNREACRDLSGRRLRDVNHEKAMAEWVKQQAEREAEKEQKRLERLHRKLAEPKHCFASPDYQQQCHEMAERLEDSVLKGMQAASSKMVSADLRETRKRPHKSKTDHGVSAEKKKCFWLGTEGLEAAEASSSASSDDDSDEEPGTSGLSCCAPQDGGLDDVEADRPPSPQSPVVDPRQDILEHTCAELREASTKDHRGTGMVPEAVETPGRRKTESPEATETVTAEAGLKLGRETEETAGGDREDGKNAPGTLEASQPGDAVLAREAVDLLAFSSAAELELLGLEKLKSELLALGLKCGGTLQERAARLFSVRGLAREEIDPALFAKPSRGKKK